MSKDDKPKKKLKGPWESIHGAIWLIGLAILFYRGDIFPGILVLVGISILAQAAIEKFYPDAVEVTPSESQSIPQPPAPPAPPGFTPVAAPASNASAVVSYPVDRLPSECLKCGAPVHAGEVRWQDEKTPHCAFCNAILPLK